jgi:hypothetical protein
MPHFERIFLCKTCRVPAVATLFMQGVTIVECPKCKAGEMWGEVESLPTPDPFTHADRKAVAC